MGSERIQFIKPLPDSLGKSPLSALYTRAPRKISLPSEQFLSCCDTEAWNLPRSQSWWDQGNHRRSGALERGNTSTELSDGPQMALRVHQTLHSYRIFASTICKRMSEVQRTRSTSHKLEKDSSLSSSSSSSSSSVNVVYVFKGAYWVGSWILWLGGILYTHVLMVKWSN